MTVSVEDKSLKWIGYVIIVSGFQSLSIKLPLERKKIITFERNKIGLQHISSELII